MKTSFPKKDIKVVLLEGIHQSAIEVFRNAGYTRIEHHDKALPRDELFKAIADAHIVGLRSRTQLDAEAIAQARRLLAVGCFCIGTNQVDLDQAHERAVPVFNAPYSNTRSVAELVIAEAILLMRRVPERNAECHRGGWSKSADGSFEVRGKTLGIVGYGNIGSQVGNLAESLGMTVRYFDTSDKLQYGNVKPAASLDELLKISDVVSLHVPSNKSTAKLFTEAKLRKMKKGAFLLNNARGSVVDLEALAKVLTEGHLAGAAIDVFPVEPASNADRFVSPLQGLENVILTPHIGGSTEEAQERIGTEVARKLVEYSDVGSTVGAVNFPQVQLPPRPTGTRFMHVHENRPGILNNLMGIFSRHDINIASQFLQTDGEVGYIVIEADGVGGASEEILDEIRAVPGTIRARLLY